MIRPLELAVGLRYTRAKRRNHYISFITFTSMAGIVLGVWALITVMSVMNGFQKELRDRILYVVSHVTISGYDGWLDDWREVAGQVAEIPEVEASAPYILGQGMLTRGRAVSGALIRGVLPERERKVSRVFDNIVEGSAELEPGGFGIILGKTLARRLGVRVGGKVTVVAPKGRVTPAGLMPKLKRFTVIGLFEIGMYEFDNGITLIHIEDARRLLGTGGQVTGLRLKLENVYSAPRLRERISEHLGGQYRVRDWSQEHANFFRALEIEKRVVFIVLFLIVAVAAFNIVSTLVMVVTDKQSDVAILRTLGMSPGSIMKVFMVQGTVIGVVGTLLGALFGVLTALNIDVIVPFIENLLNTQLFPADVYVISEFPGELRWSDVTKVVTISLLLSFLATIYPAWRASRVEPAEALRYE